MLHPHHLLPVSVINLILSTYFGVNSLRMLILFYSSSLGVDNNSVRFIERWKTRFDYYILKDSIVNAFLGVMIRSKIVSSIQRVLQHVWSKISLDMLCLWSPLSFIGHKNRHDVVRAYDIYSTYCRSRRNVPYDGSSERWSTSHHIFLYIWFSNLIFQSSLSTDA